MVLGLASVLCLMTPLMSTAQTTAKNAMTPARDLEAKANKQTEKAAKELALNDEQKSKFKKFAMDRLYKVQPINEKIKATKDEAEKQNLKAQKKQINEEFFNNVNNILTPAQQELWKKKKEELMEHKHEK
ncbi:MAG: hypothetical protein KatS3mg027_1031 [Bacteroidia bacterium]|nr:MAG: hypothetical protein KatS3mg027_1031 [Bacteroidia bacterium]